MSQGKTKGEALILRQETVRLTVEKLVNPVT